MKTTSLNAVPQRTRSVSTAKIQSERGGDRGREHHPDDVALQRGADAVVGEQRLVVVESGEAVTGLVVKLRIGEYPIG